MIIDAHVHVVSLDRERYPLSPVSLPNGAWYLDRPVDAGAMLNEMQRAGVDAAVLVQAKGAYDYDNAYVADAVQQSPRFVGVGVADPSLPASVEALHAAGLGGVRLFDIPTGTHRDLTSELATCERFAMVAVPTMMLSERDRLREAARAFPAVSIAVDHCLFAELDDPDQRAGLRAALLDLPNVHLKVTSHVLLHTSDPAGSVAWLVDTFGAHRLLWGSDFPQTPDASYAELVDLARRSTEQLSAVARDQILGLTALELWPDLGGQPGLVGGAKNA